MFHVKHCEVAATVGPDTKDLENFLKERFAQLKKLLHGAETRELEPTAYATLAQYLKLLSHWTTKVDLVAPAALLELAERHIVDCLAVHILLARADLSSAPREILDIGSGAGLPGLILAIANPQISVCLLEPREKRVIFLQEARRVLGLDNITIRRGRLEQCPPKSLSSVGLYISRAVAEPEKLLPLAAPYLESSATIFFMLGPNTRIPTTVKVGDSSQLSLLGQTEYTLSEDGPRRILASWGFV